MLISKFKTHDMETEVSEFEKKYNMSLPEQYRNFLLKYNGGETPLTNFKNKKDDTDLRAFFGIGEIDYYSFDRFDSDWETPLSEWLKKGLIPIAEDSWGNYFSIKVNGSKIGSVYFCDHEKGFKAKLVSKDLKEFVSNCKSQKIGKVLTIEEREKQVREYGMVEPDDGLRKLWQEQIDQFSKYKQERVIIN